jgi:hypothetical protein
MRSLIKWATERYRAVITPPVPLPRGTGFTIRYRCYTAGRFTASLPWTVWDGKVIVDRLETREVAVTRYPGAKVIEPAPQHQNNLSGEN